MKGGMEAIYDDLKTPLGLGGFAPLEPARGPMFSARKRAGLVGEPKLPDPVKESE